MKRTIKKYQNAPKPVTKNMGMTMVELKKKYRNADTLRDVRGEEVNANAPKKILEQYNDTYNAFERKFGNKAAPSVKKPAKQKMGGVTKKKLKMGGAVKKGDLVAAGVTKTTKKAPMVDPKGAFTKVQQRTLGNMKKGGKMSKKK